VSLAQYEAWVNTEFGAAAFALTLAAISSVLAALTTRRGLGVAVIITVLFVSSTAVSATQGIAQQFGNDRLASYLGLLSPFALADGVQVAVVNAPYSAVAPPPAGVGQVIFVVAMVVLVVGCFALLLRRYRGLGAL
jgi:ABC-2 type transport system permease protein